MTTTGQPLTAPAPPDPTDPDLKFVWETLKKVGLFLVIAGAAAVLHLIVLGLEHYMPNAITYPLTFVEYALLVFDVIWFLKGLAMEIGALMQGVIAGTLSVRVLLFIVIFALGAILSAPLKEGILTVFRAIGSTADAVDFAPQKTINGLIPTRFYAKRTRAPHR